MARARRVDTVFVCYALDCDAGVVGQVGAGDLNLRVHSVMSSSLGHDGKALAPLSSLSAGEVAL